MGWLGTALKVAAFPAIGPLGLLGVNKLEKSFAAGGAPAERELPPLSPEAVALADAQKARADRSESDFTNDITHGTNQGQNLQAAMNQASAGNTSLGGTQEYSQALKNKQSKNYEQDINQFERKAKAKAITDKFDATKVAAEHARSRWEYENGINNRIYEKDQADKQARSAMLGQVLGIAGTIGGAVVGGPVGAQVGGSIGKSAGGMA